jgi:hypothetical protein
MISPLDGGFKNIFQTRSLYGIMRKTNRDKVKNMVKLFGKNNDLRTEEGKITNTGYAVMALSAAFGLCVFLTGRYIYGKTVQKKK